MLGVMAELMVHAGWLTQALALLSRRWHISTPGGLGTAVPQWILPPVVIGRCRVQPMANAHRLRFALYDKIDPGILELAGVNVKLSDLPLHTWYRTNVIWKTAGRKLMENWENKAHSEWHWQRNQQLSASEKRPRYNEKEEVCNPVERNG